MLHVDTPPPPHPHPPPLQIVPGGPPRDLVSKVIDATSYVVSVLVLAKFLVMLVRVGLAM